MITLLASIAGFISSIFPEFFKIIKDKNDKNHEIRIFDKQIEMQKLGITNRLEEINAYGDIVNSKSIYKTYKTGITWIDALNGTVRPVLAYSFFLLYAIVKIMQFYSLDQAISLLSQIDTLWKEDDQAIFAGIISFYYGQRSMYKHRNKK